MKIGRSLPGWAAAMSRQAGIARQGLPRCIWLLAVAALLPRGLAEGAPSAQVPGSPGQTPALSDGERYVDLIKRKERAERLNALWQVEAELSAKRTAYAVLDLSERKLYFKVRGRVFKAISFTGLDVSRGSGPAATEDLAWRAFTLQIKEGKGVETETIQRKTLTPEEARLAGRTESGDEPMGAEQGEVVSGDGASSSSGSAGSAGAAGSAPATQKMAGVAGGLIPPDPPRRYHLGFDGELSIWVVADTDLPPQAARYERFLPLAKAIGRFYTGTGEEARETRVTVRLPLDRAQQIFRQLLPGQRLLVTL